MNVLDRIELDPKICNGKPVIKDTRIPVSVILDQMAEKESLEAILKIYPELKKEDLQAALLYARTAIEHTEVQAAGELEKIIHHNNVLRHTGEQ